MTEYYPNEELKKSFKSFEGIPIFYSLDGSSEKKPDDPQVGTVGSVKLGGNKLVVTLFIENTEGDLNK